MADLNIARDAGNAEFEKYLASDLAATDLKIPNDLTEGGALGTSLALAQFLLTWSRAGSERTLHTHLQPKENAEALTKFIGRAHGLAATYFASRVLAVDGVTDIRRDLLVAARPRIDAMHTADLPKTARGPLVEMIFAEGAQREFHGSVYLKAPTLTEIMDRDLHGRLIRSRSDLNKFIQYVARTLDIETPLSQWLDDTEQLPFGSLLHEIFRNTAEHAYLTTAGTRLAKNLRCIQFSRSMITRQRVAEIRASAPEAASRAAGYFERVARLRSEMLREKMQFFEMSVLDSGPGYAATIRKKGSAEESDIDGTIRCFTKHQTAKTFSAAGLGLYRILEIIRNTDGFLRVRTGTVEAFFAATATPGNINIDDPKPYVHGKLAHVEGSLVTIGIPIFY